MLNIIWDTRQYFFWLLLISLLVWGLERLYPWRKEQKAFRKQFAQDVFWLIFNGHYLGILLAYLTSWAVHRFNDAILGLNLPTPESLQLLSDVPLWAQFAIFIVVKDFVEWCIHNLLHRVPWLWEFHKLHHSIRELDWIGNMRFHWMEVVVYKTLSYLPLVMMGVNGEVILWVAIVSTLIGHLNHSNLNISWGPLRYVINSPRMHVWHHDLVLHGRHGQNYGVIFSLWDWLFGTAYMPEGQPEQLGFKDIDEFPERLAGRLIYPFNRLFSGKKQQ